MLFLLVSLCAWAGVPEQLEATEAFRSQRLAQGVPVVTPQQYASALAGEEVTGLIGVEGHGAKKGYGVRVVDVPIDKMWAAVNDDRGKVRYTKLSYTEVVDGRHCQDGRRVFQFLPVPLVTDRWWQLDVRLNTAIAKASSGAVREMFFKSVNSDELATDTMRAQARRGVRIAFAEGAWYLRDMGNGQTLVEYYTWSDPGGSIPSGFASVFRAPRFETRSRRWSTWRSRARSVRIVLR